MNRILSAARRILPVLALALTLTLLLQVAPALAGLGTSPTIQYSQANYSATFLTPTSIVFSGLVTLKDYDNEGNVLKTYLSEGDPFELYIGDAWIASGSTKTGGTFQLSIDPSWLLPGVYPMLIKFKCPEICGESPDVVAPPKLTVDGAYLFPGFQPPLTPGTLNTVKAGQTVVLKWQIADENAAPLGELRWITSIESVPLPDCGDEPAAPLAAADTSGSSGLRYDPEAGQYVFAFKTDKAWAGSCRQLVLTLINGDSYPVDFQFK
jgi:hypothetical protein